MEADALELAGIHPSRQGARRHARLSDEERKLYFWILRRFATHGRPRSDELRAEAEWLGADLEGAAAALARQDLVHLGPDGGVDVAYPFSGRPTAHRIRFANGHEVSAMCAIDALGVAPMFEQTIAIASRDPVTGEEIEVQATAEGGLAWQPSSAVVVLGAVRSDGDSCEACCPVLNFFAARESAERWLAEHENVRGRLAAIDEAADVGRAVFGAVFGSADGDAA